MRPAIVFRDAWLLALALTALSSSILQSREDASSTCARAAADAASRTGVPYDVLLAIALVETGRDGRPWPWTVNAGGDGHWFDTLEEAAAHAEAVLGQGVTNVDIGCFQLNYRWHGAAFASVAEMLDPDRNATYAAEFLRSLFEKGNDWTTAAASYHSATPEYAEAYRVRFETVRADLGGGVEYFGARGPARTNRFPLLVAGSQGSRGSLVPVTGGGIPLIGGP